MAVGSSALHNGRALLSRLSEEWTLLGTWRRRREDKGKLCEVPDWTNLAHWRFLVKTVAQEVLRKCQPLNTSFVGRAQSLLTRHHSNAAGPASGHPKRFALRAPLPAMGGGGGASILWALRAAPFSKA
jgi:hypothetical protein